MARSARKRAISDEPPRKAKAAAHAAKPTASSRQRASSASSRSIRREIIRLTLLCELFGYAHTTSAIAEVMSTGHVGADYVEYVLRHKRRLEPQLPPLRLGKPELDGISLSEPDMTVYDQLGAPPSDDAPEGDTP